MVREYRNVFGAVEPAASDFFYMIEPPNAKPLKKKMGRPKLGEAADSHKPKPKPIGVKSRFMNEFMQALCDKYPNDLILMLCDNAWWHKSKYIKIPERLTIIYIPPYTPEMNPIEQLWREIRTGFHNKYFKTIADVEKHLHATIATIKPETIRSITQRDWLQYC